MLREVKTLKAEKKTSALPKNGPVDEQGREVLLS